MANILQDIRKGFYDRLLSGTTALKTLITKVVGATTFYRLYYDQAPQVFPGTSTAVAPPFIVISILPIDQDRDTASRFYRCIVQFLVASLSLSECETLAGYVMDQLEDAEASITVGTYRLLEIRRQPLIFLGQSEQVYTAVVQYSIILQQ